MAGRSIKLLLLVEDNVGDARLLHEMFADDGGLDTVVTRVASMKAAEQHLAERQTDLILLDLGLPDAHGLEAVRRAQVVAPRVPLVVLTGLDNEELATQALKEGAQDYLVKGQIDARTLVRALRYAMERRTMDEALYVEKERAEVTLDSIGDGVISTDTDGIITFVNAVAEQLTGWGRAEAIGQPIASVLQIRLAASGDTPPDPMALAMEQDRTVHLLPNCLLIRRDGAEVAIDHSVSPIHNRDRVATGAVMVLRDVTVARVIERQLQTVSDELARSNRELQDFATVASHDLQEPLRKIRAFGDRLEEHSGASLDPEALDYLSRMKSAAGRMQSLINDLLGYSRVTMQPEAAQPVDLAQVVAEVLVDLDERLVAAGGAVHVGPLPTILANPLHMRQLFQNLIANALKFHAPGVAPDVSVEVVTSSRRDAVPLWEIRVADNGIGFDDQYVEKMFAPFGRLNGRGAYEGTGMGLAICRRIVALRGGTLTATSAPGAGATFLVSLPRAVPAVAAAPLAGAAR